MVRFGYKLMTEEHGPKALVENAVRAEAAGFDFVSISDHFHPWLEAQGHAPFAWSVLGAIANATSTIGLTTGVTCPILRYHPAVIAQAAATIAVMSDSRFTLAIGAGERLNEHVTGARWPSVPERHAMLSEAIDIFRGLWAGDVYNHAGAHFLVDHAQLYDLPDHPIPVVLAVSGAASIALAVEKADGVMTTEPKAELAKGFRQRAGEGRPCYVEVVLSYGSDAPAALAMAHERFKFSAFGWAVMSELPSVQAFEAAGRFVSQEDLRPLVAAGPDVQQHLAMVRKAIDAGYDHIVLTCPGPNQASFIDFFERALGPALRDGSAGFSKPNG